MTDLVTVEQCDRDAAASVERVSFVRLYIRKGINDDHPTVQAFARHRLAERERCAKVAETQFEAREWHPERRCAGANIAGEIRTTIRSGKEPV